MKEHDQAKDKVWKFWIEAEGNVYLAWDYLTQAEAKKMHKKTERNQAKTNTHAINRFGWELMRGF